MSLVLVTLSGEGENYLLELDRFNSRLVNNDTRIIALMVAVNKTKFRLWMTLSPKFTEQLYWPAIGSITYVWLRRHAGTITRSYAAEEA